MKHSILPIFILFLISASCNTKEVDQWEDKTIRLKGEPVAMEHFFYSPRDICIKDSILFIKDYGADTIFYAYNISHTPFTLLKSWGTKGDGPNEYIYPSPLRRINNAISFYDKALLKLHTIGPDIEIRHEPIAYSGFNNVLKIRDNTYIGDGYFNDSRFKLLKEDVCSSLSIQYPHDGIDCPLIQKSLAYQGDLVRQPNGDRFVYTSSYGGIVEIYQINQNDISLVDSKVYAYPLYMPYKHSQNEVSANFQKENVKGSLSTYATDRFIYMLYSGKAVSDPDHSYSDIIYVFDWDGNELCQYIPDQDLSCICVDDNDLFLYGVCHSKEEENKNIELIKYKLPEKNIIIQPL